MGRIEKIVSGATILGCIFGGYQAYVMWDGRHPGMWRMIHYWASVVAVLLIFSAGIGNLILSRRNRLERIRLENLAVSSSKNEHARLHYESSSNLQNDNYLSDFQTRCLRLSRDLEGFIKSMDGKDGTPHMWAVYERDFSPRIQSVVLEMSLLNRPKDKYLSNYSNSIHDLDNVNTLRARLWLAAMYEETIDFTGNC